MWEVCQRCPPGHRGSGAVSGVLPALWGVTVFACAEDLCGCWETRPSDTSFSRFIFLFCLKKTSQPQVSCPYAHSWRGLEHSWSAVKGRSAQRSAEFPARADGSACSVIPSSPDTPALMAPALPGCRPALPSQPGGFGSAFVVGRRLQGDRLCRRSCRSRVGAGGGAWRSTGRCWLPGGRGASSGSVGQMWEVPPTCRGGIECRLELLSDPSAVPFPPVPRLQRAVTLGLCWRGCAELPPLLRVSGALR